jgi:hypothetical protein
MSEAAPGEGDRAVPRLKLTEIFRSLQGESDSVGIPTVFVRLTGCPLRCSYCDTAYAFHGGEWWTLPAILDRVRNNLGGHDRDVINALVDGNTARADAIRLHEAIDGIYFLLLVWLVIWMPSRRF